MLWCWWLQLFELWVSLPSQRKGCGEDGSTPEPAARPIPRRRPAAGWQHHRDGRGRLRGQRRLHHEAPRAPPLAGSRSDPAGALHCAYLADAFIQSDLRLIRLTRGKNPPEPMKGVKGLAQGPNTAAWILMWLHRGLNHHPAGSHSCTLATRLPRNQLQFLHTPQMSMLRAWRQGWGGTVDSTVASQPVGPAFRSQPGPFCVELACSCTGFLQELKYYPSPVPG